MRHKVAGRKLGRSSSHRASLFKNLATDLLKHEKIVTTEAKAKESRGLAEKLITLGKDGSLSSRRRVISLVTDKGVVDKVFDELSTRYADRTGGYTRILRLGPRHGDGAFMVQLELV
jgi:large subunit ribosomal protein L17